MELGFKDGEVAGMPVRRGEIGSNGCDLCFRQRAHPPTRVSALGGAPRKRKYLLMRRSHGLNGGDGYLPRLRN
jgi:hypothetical protein